jgi:endonuclease/exonuclease/phosphatase family metal-dependent hydrolase
MRPRITNLLFAIPLLAFAACQQPASHTDPEELASQTQAADRVTVLTYNIHHGQGTDGVFDLPRIADVIRRSNADLVALQEVDVLTKRASGVDQASELARLTGMYHAFGRAIPYSDGAYGDAVLSRWPILRVETIALPAEPNHEDRVAVMITVQMPESQRKMRFISTHFDHTSNPSDRVAQAKHLSGEIFPSELPTLVLGDLNAQPGSEPVEILNHWLRPAAPPNLYTMPSDQPKRKIDWVLMSRAHNWQVREVRTYDEPVASDHAPLMAELELMP